MSWAVYTSLAAWDFDGDPRAPRGSGKVIPSGSLIVLDDTSEAPSALAAGTVSSVAPTLTGGQTTTLAAMQGVLQRAAVVQALALP